MVRPRPIATRDTAWWFDGWNRNELLIQRCDGCGRLRHPPQPRCAGCGSPEWTSVKASGRGQLFSYIVSHHPPVDGFEAPFVVAVVELAEGTRLVSNVIGASPEDLYVGMPLELDFVPVEPDMTLPQFVPAGPATSNSSRASAVAAR
ncbi:MAG: hypothetical protein JWP02_2821 [Acidimicrobiales bacterium]|nr:hypothetical protein [Acidimicrobiales bacterium]